MWATPPTGDPVCGVCLREGEHGGHEAWSSSTRDSGRGYCVRGYSSVVEHSTADREVPGSNPGAPYFFFSLISDYCFNSLHVNADS